MLHGLSLPTPFPVGPVNVYLAEGDPLTLIDTGPKDDLTRAALEAGLKEHGYRIEDLRRIILTHHHVDHIGLTAEIVARSGAEVLTHPYNLPWLADYTAERERHRPFFQKIWDEGGVPDEIVQAMDKSGAGIARWLDPFAEAQPINEGEHLSFGERRPLPPKRSGVGLGIRDWQVFHTPGHAGGLICLWDAASRTLIANDHFIRDISSNPVLEPPPLTPAPTGRPSRPGGLAARTGCGVNGPRPKRLVEYLHHMQRMAALAPLVALPGHGEPVNDVPGLVRQRLAFHKRRAQKILDTLEAGPMTLWDLTQPIFPRLTRGMDFFLGLSEILGHLDLLEEAGTARPRREGERVRWARV